MIDPYDLALIALGALLVLIAAALLWRRVRARAPAPPYVVKEAILSWEEHALFHLIEEAIDSEFRLLFRIRLADLLEPTAESASKRRRALEAIEGRTIPLLICRANDFSPVAAIAPGKGDAHPFPELSACGIAVLQFSATPLPSPQEIRSELDRHLSGSGERESSAEDEETVGEGDDWRIGSHFPPAQEEGGWLDGLSQSPPVAEVREEEKESRPEMDGTLLCPECGGAMTRRRMVRGPHAGRELWVCADFPACRKTIPVLHD